MSSQASFNNTDNFADAIAASWARCQQFGLSHTTRPPAVTFDEQDLARLRNNNAVLLATTENEVLPYYDNILSNSRSMIVLADSGGRVLKYWGDQRFIEAGRESLFIEGRSWLEQSNGTNAIGTAIASGQAVQVQRNQHFLKANRFMTGCAAPILDAKHRLLGVLNVSSDAYLPQAHTLGMVKLMSLAIENRLMMRSYKTTCFLLTLNTHADNLDSEWSGLIAFDEDGYIRAANRRALQLLGNEVVGQPLAEVFPANQLQPVCEMADGSHLQLTNTRQRRFHGLIKRPEPDNAESDASTKTVRTSASARPPQGELSTGTGQSGPVPLKHIEFGDPQIKRCIRQASRVADKDIPILIHGETGVGKEVFVKALHNASARHDQPLVAVNCAAIPSELIESELFGYEKGAFTGANTRGAIGLIRKAHQGILFLDEIGEMPPRAQARLLRVLQEREVTPLGSTEAYPVDIRLVSATNQHLEEHLESGLFRRDLFYRISGLNIELPPLRKRADKREIFRQVHRQHREADQAPDLPDAVLDLFEKHPWPGNIRQLINVIKVALAMADSDPLEMWHLPDDFIRDLQAMTAPSTDPDNLRMSETVALESSGNGLDQLLETYNHYQGNISRTARQLGFSRNTIYKHLRELGVR
ncbi:sigma-54-dependent Fis family transcriptional regulator [Marinobacter sp. 1Y8]